MTFKINGWGDDEELLEDDGPMFGGAERYEKKKKDIERAREIDSGISSGILEKDEEVLDILKKIQE